MPGFAFRTALTFDWDGVAHRIERLGTDDQVVVARISDEQIILSSRQVLLTDFAQGRISVLERTDVSPSRAYGRPLCDLPTHVQAEVRRRMAYLDAIDKSGPIPLTADHANPLIKEVANQINDKKPPSLTTLYRWHCAYRLYQDSRALVPRFDRRGSKGPRQTGRILELFTEAVEEAYRASPAATIKNIHTRFEGKLKAENAKRLPEDQFKLPKLRTTYRLFGRVEAFDQIRLKEGKHVADRRFRLVKAGPSVDGILQRVEVDHSPLDLFLIDEVTGLPLGRPVLTLFLDVFSRFPIGYYLSYGGTSAAAVIGGLRHAILPKTPVKEVLPDLPIDHAWPCYGRISTLVVDNGLEFFSTSLDSIAMDLGFRIQFCPKRQPWFKGSIERFLKTINYFLSHQLPGTSLAKQADRGDYDPEKHALLTLGEFKHLLEKWLLDVYAQSIHRGIHTTPWAKWQEGLTRFSPELPGSLNELQRRVGLVEERSLRHDGIVLKGIRYVGPNLEPILRAWGPGVKLRIVFDPEDMGAIQVWAPEVQDPVAVLALNQTYARGLTLLQHELIQQKVRENGHSAENPEALAKAKYDLALAVDELLKSRKQRGRRRAANIHGKTSTHPEARLATGQPPKPVAKPVPISKSPDDEPPTPLTTFQIRSGGNPQ